MFAVLMSDNLTPIGFKPIGVCINNINFNPRITLKILCAYEAAFSYILITHSFADYFLRP